MSDRITQEDIGVLWMQLTKLYGYKFTRCYGDEDDGTWYTVLSDLTKSDLSYGLFRLKKEFHESEIKNNTCWPPNAKEMRLLCLQMSILEENEIKHIRKQYFELQDQLTTEKAHKSHWLRLYSLIKDDPSKLQVAQGYLEYAKQNKLKAIEYQKKVSTFLKSNPFLLELKSI